MSRCILRDTNLGGSQSIHCVVQSVRCNGRDTPIYACITENTLRITRNIGAGNVEIGRDHFGKNTEVDSWISVHIHVEHGGWSIIIARCSLHHRQRNIQSRTQERDLSTGGHTNTGGIGRREKERAVRRRSEILRVIVGARGNRVGFRGRIVEILIDGNIVLRNGDRLQPDVECVGDDGFGIVIAGNGLECRDGDRDIRSINV